MKVLVTGGCGFIFSHFIEYTLARRPDVSVLNVDKLDYNAREYNVAPHPRYEFAHLDLKDLEALRGIFRRFKPDVVVHGAAQSHVCNSFENVRLYIEDNVLGTYSVLECVKEFGGTLMHISTDEVYGEVELEETSHPASSLLNPTNPYSATKGAAELLVNAYGHSFGIKYLITRGNNVFGPRQFPEKLIPCFIQNMLRGEPCKVHGEGRARRNFIYVDDTCSALLLLLDKLDEPGVLGKVRFRQAAHARDDRRCRCTILAPRMSILSWRSITCFPR